MFKSARLQQPKRGGNPEINMAPLIDMVFILLIFFLVTTAFVKDTGIKVDKPQAVSAGHLDNQSLRIGISASGLIFVEGEQLDIGSLREKVGHFLKRERDGSVIVVPDKSLASGRLVEVLDAAKLGGARNIAIATEKK